MHLSLCCMPRMCCHAGKLCSSFYPSSAAYRRPDFPGAPLSRVLGLPAKLLLPHAMDADFIWNLFRLWTVTQSGTPVGQERQYSWKPTAGRLVVTTPPAGDVSEDQQASSATPPAELVDSKDSETSRMRSTGMQTRLPGRPRPTMAPRLLAEATTQRRPSSAARSPDSPTGYSAGTVPEGSATSLPGSGTLRTLQMTAPRKALRILSELTPPATALKKKQAARTPHGTRIPHSVFPSPNQDTDTQARSVAPHEDPYASAIDFGFAVTVTSGPATNTTEAQGRGQPRAAAKSLVRSGLRCHKCFLKFWVCLCDRAPVEIDRRDPASGASGQYKILHQLYVRPLVLLCPTVGEKWHATCSGSAPGQHSRRTAALGQKAAMPLSHSLVGEPVKVAFSASAQRQQRHGPFQPTLPLWPEVLRAMSSPSLLVCEYRGATVHMPRCIRIFTSTIHAFCHSATAGRVSGTELHHFWCFSARQWAQGGAVHCGLPASLDHERFCSLRSCMGPLADAHTPWLSVRTDAISSQKLYVVVHTADQEASWAHAAMPSPSAKLKAARRLPKHLRLSGAPPSGALAEARAEVAARYARGESNQHGQHSCLQGASHTQGAAAEQQAWYDHPWHDDWWSQWGQDGWHTSTATGSTDTWQARPDLPTRPAQRWQPKHEARRDGISELASASPSEINTGTRAQMDAKLDHAPNQQDSNSIDLEVEMGQPASKKRPQMSITTGAVRSRGEGGATAPTQAEGTRLSAPSDSFEEPTQAEGTRLSAPNDSFEEMVVATPDVDTGAAQDDRRQAAGRQSEELKQAAMSRPQDDQEAQRAGRLCISRSPPWSSRRP